MAELLPWPVPQFFDDNGHPLAGGKLYSYRAGSSIPLATYADKAATTPNPNPVILNSRGEATVYLSPQAYKLVLTDANDVVIWTRDNFVLPNLDTETLAEAIELAQDAQEAAEDAQADAESAAQAAEAAKNEATEIIQGTIFGSRASPIQIQAATGISFVSTKFQNYMYVEGGGGPVDISADPQISAGTMEGQRLTLQGRSDTNTVRLHHGDGIALKNQGEVYLHEDETITFWWDGTLWIEI